MRIFFGVGKSMMHAMHNSISAGHQIGRALREIRQKVKYTLPYFAHGEHFVRGVPVMKKCLKKNGTKPMPNKKSENGHKNGF